MVRNKCSAVLVLFQSTTGYSEAGIFYCMIHLSCSKYMVQLVLQSETHFLSLLPV